MAGRGLYLHSRMVVDGHLFWTHPHVLHQDEFYGGRHGHERVMLQGKAQAIRPKMQQPNPKPPTAPPGKSGCRGPRSRCQPRVLITSGTQAPRNPSCRPSSEATPYLMTLPRQVPSSYLPGPTLGDSHTQP